MSHFRHYTERIPNVFEVHSMSDIGPDMTTILTILAKSTVTTSLASLAPTPCAALAKSNNQP